MSVVAQSGTVHPCDRWLANCHQTLDHMDWFSCSKKSMH